MDVYRLENAHGEGPYNTGMHYRATMQLCDTPDFQQWAPQCDRCPAPDSDIGQKWKDLVNGRYCEGSASLPDSLDYRFGFCSLQDLWNWFGDCLHVLYDPPVPERTNMLRDAFTVKIYKVSPQDVMYGMRQVAWPYMQAEFIGSIPEYRFVKLAVNSQPLRRA